MRNKVLTEELGDLLGGGGLVSDGLVVLGALLLELHLAQVHHHRGHLGWEEKYGEYVYLMTKIYVCLL